MALRQLLRPLLPSPPHLAPHRRPPPQPPPPSRRAVRPPRLSSCSPRRPPLRRALLAPSPAVRMSMRPASSACSRYSPLRHLPPCLHSSGTLTPPARHCDCMQEASPSVVFIKDLVVAGKQVQGGGGEVDEDVDGAKVEGTGSGFVWDSAGHIVFFEDSSGKSYSKEGTLIGYDPAYDLAVLKVDVDGEKLRPALIGTSRGLRVGQSCFAIGNPYGYEHTLTTGVVSGLGREIPSPNGRAIRGAIQTDAAINAGSGISSGVNFAIPIDTVVHFPRMSDATRRPKTLLDSCTALQAGPAAGPKVSFRSISFRWRHPVASPSQIFISLSRRALLVAAGGARCVPARRRLVPPARPRPRAPARRPPDSLCFTTF
ncbi:hypothetical protein PR202_gb24310 [Eleusine coracana subsp. coracana]|uniref:Uncharacterized protein n=1 Tax=Eleusine coracana subsp. coracana TaxID=191504 RepID=A0AAV5FL48_ELECO|nr:hypothetical protein PR202_gb24310 [Eleusine coracana subsp. coracana]